MNLKDSKTGIAGQPFLIKWCLMSAALMVIVCSARAATPVGNAVKHFYFTVDGLRCESRGDFRHEQRKYRNSTRVSLHKTASQTSGSWKLTNNLALLLFAQNDVETAQEVFSQRSYPWYDQELDKSRPLELGERLAPKSADRNNIRLQKQRPKTGGGGGGGGGGLAHGLSGLAWVGVGVLIALLAALMIWAFFKIESNSRTKSSQIQQRSLAESIEHLPFQIDQKTGNFRDLAQRASQAGDYRRAIVFLFSHVLVTLDQNHLIRLRKGRTNRQYLNDLRNQRPLANFFQKTMEPFEFVFFGDHDLTQTEFESCWQELESFQNEVAEAVNRSNPSGHSVSDRPVQVAS